MVGYKPTNEDTNRFQQVLELDRQSVKEVVASVEVVKVVHHFFVASDLLRIPEGLTPSKPYQIFGSHSFDLIKCC